MANPSGQGEDGYVQMLDRLDEFDHPWLVNEHGLWCGGCGEHIAAPWNITETYAPPQTCKHCGWPDEFEAHP